MVPLFIILVFKAYAGILVLKTKNWRKLQLVGALPGLSSRKADPRKAGLRDIAIWNEQT
jgi:hypothetical protein